MVGIYVTLCFASLSVASVSLLVVTSLSLAHLRRWWLPNRAPVYLATAGIVRALSLLILCSGLLSKDMDIDTGEWRNTFSGAFCWTIELTQLWSIISCALWFLMICVMLLLSVSLRVLSSKRHFRIMEAMALVVCYGVTAVVALVTALVKYFAFPSSVWPWCERFSRWEMVVQSLFLPLGLVVLIVVSVYVFRQRIMQVRLSYMAGKEEVEKKLMQERLLIFRRVVAFPLTYGLFECCQLIAVYIQAFNTIQNKGASLFVEIMNLGFAAIAPGVLAVLYAVFNAGSTWESARILCRQRAARDELDKDLKPLEWQGESLVVETASPATAAL
eukprot:TRINITY_DN904_c0_g1_i1.p1 TRINITY_DN904_c0_g1~~TRINITY_DN904_c0_g1_i1.p1  ORF type:complete len:377 (+),score=104.06 TRINITY_DN904_c0_g1_i1:143-1132(+)